MTGTEDEPVTEVCVPSGDLARVQILYQAIDDLSLRFSARNS